MQKINFNTQFFLEILQRNSRFVILNRNLWRLSAGKKIKFIFNVFLEILQKYCELVILGNLGMPGSAHPKRYYQLEENFCVYLQAINKLHSPCFLDILQRYANFLFRVFWVPWAYFDYAHPKWWYHFVEKFDVYLNAKNNLSLTSLLRY